MPMNVLLYSGYLKNIPMALEEAADIDGASTWTTYWRVVFPMMKPMHATVAILTALGTWNDVMTPLVIMSGTGQNTLPLAQLNFQTQFGTNYNLAFASYILALIPILIFYIICQKRLFLPYCRCFSRHSPCRQGRRIPSKKPSDSQLRGTAIISILNRLKPYNATYASIARMSGVSSTRIMEIFDTFVRIKRHSLPRVLLIDEFHFSRNSKYKYPAILMNFENNLIIDIVESRTHDIMSDYLFKIDLEERKKVEYICTDMSFIFEPLLKTYFPNSTLLVDHFHVTRLINDQLNHTRKRIMRKYVKNKKSREYRLLKHRYKILLKSKNNIDNETFKYDKIMECHVTENMILETLLSFDDELRQAYNAKEEYLIFDQVSKGEVNNSNKRKELDAVIKKFKHTHVEESISVAVTLEHWKEEILNSFTWINDRRISNGPCEGKNNYVKKILSNANGMSNFQRVRNRILYSQNKYETYTMNEHTDRIKRIGNPRGAYKK